MYTCLDSIRGHKSLESRSTSSKSKQIIQQAYIILVFNNNRGKGFQPSGRVHLSQILRELVPELADVVDRRLAHERLGLAP